MAVGGAIVGGGLVVAAPPHPADVTVGHALANPERDVPVPETVVDCVLQIIAVGFGASLGREGAPRQLGAAGGAFIARRLGMSLAQRRTVMACGAGAGLAAVYNVPLGGAVFTMEILLVSVRMRELGPALAASGIATVVAWPVLSRPADLRDPGVHAHPVDRGLGGAVTHRSPGRSASAFVRLMFAAGAHVPNGWRLPPTVFVVFTALGALAIPYPQLLGNGKGAGGARVRRGACRCRWPSRWCCSSRWPPRPACAPAPRGGLLTPALATGALFGVATGRLWSDVFGHLDSGACALIGAAAVLATTHGRR